MSFESFVALRYLAASRRKAHVALIATISILGLAIGVAALVISLALLSGFQDRIRAQMAARTPHLEVTPARGALLADPGAVRQALESLPGIVSVEPLVEGRGWLSDAEGTTALPVRFKSGVFREARSAGPPPARLAGTAAGRAGVGFGSLVRLTSSRTRLSPIGPIPIAVELKVVDMRRGSALDRSPDVEVPEAVARTLAALPEGAPAYTARLERFDRAEEAARQVSMRLGPAYRVRTWRELNASLGFALRLEKLVIFVTVALVILVAALNIVSNIALLVVEKKRDLGVFSTLGASPESLGRVYVILGLAIGGLGTGLGLAGGAGLSWLLDRYHLVPLPADVYMLSHVPFALHPGELALVAAFSLATALAAAALPARAAARLAPGEAIRLSR
jgi:lipoprotein-releasing system permease protein